MPEKGQGCDEDYERRVDGPLRDDRAQRLWEGHTLPTFQYPAARYLTGTWYDEACRVGNEDAVDGDALARLLSQWLKGLLPSPTSKRLGQNAEREREEHPRPIHLVQHHVADALDVETTIHPIKYGTTQKQGCRHLNDRVYGLLRFHCLAKL